MDVAFTRKPFIKETGAETGLGCRTTEENTNLSFRESCRDNPVPTLRPVPSGSFLHGRSQVGKDLVVRTVTEGSAQGPERSVIEKPM